MRKYPKIVRRGQPLILFISTVLGLALATLPVSGPAFANWHYNNKINSEAYLQKNGHWDMLDLPSEFKLNTVHAAMLPTGKILLVAGSGNNFKNFQTFDSKGTISVLKTVIYDPSTKVVTSVDTPNDLFCSGHALLQNGNLLVAGGTSGYEVLEKDVKKPAGPMIVHNENPDSQAKLLKKGTKFISQSGKAYASTQDITLPPATKMTHDDGSVMVMHSSQKVFVEAVSESQTYVTSKTEQYTIDGLTGEEIHDIYGQGGPMTLKKQDFRGDDKTYEFDPIQEKYVRVGDLKEARWYPSLPVLTNGDVLAVSGIDKTGVITQTTERYSPQTHDWQWGPDQIFPSYPALFRTNDPEVLFFSGSNAGYGPVNKGRLPGFWNIKTNSFTTVDGLRDQNIVETSASVMLPPTAGSNDGSQSSRIMLAGGGGIGESKLATDRTDIIDLNSTNPHYTAGPDLPDKLRYINMTVTPWDEVFAAGGTTDYRAKGNSYSLKTVSYNPTTNIMAPMADELVGRGYHSGSLLLGDGRILFFGNDALYADKDNTKPGIFEQRMEIYTPPQFYRSTKPIINGPASQEAHRGDTLNFTSNNTSQIQSARLIPPSSTTHVTNIEQRSVGVIVSKLDGHNISVRLPEDQNLLPDGWYMLFIVNKDSVPAPAKMVHISH